MKTDPTSSRSSRISAGLQSIFTLILFAFILLILNYLGFKHYVHKDLSQSQFYTLSPETVDLLKKLDSPVTIYTLLSDKYREQIENLLKEYQRVGGKNVIVEKIDPAYDIAHAAELQNKLHFDGQDHVVIFSYKDHNRFVKQDDLFDVNQMTGQVGGFKGELEFTSALLGLIEGKASKVYFTEGHGEHSLQNSQTAEGYGFMAQSLKNENLETANLNLAAKGDVPDDADAVVIAGPAVSFSPIEAEALQKYVDNNGKLFIMLDPYIALGLDDLLRKYGLKYDTDLVLYRAMSTAGSEVTVPLALIYQGGFSPHPITSKFAQANLQLQIVGARSITLLPDEKGQPSPKTQFLLQTDPNAFGWINKAATTTNAAAAFDYKDRTFDKVNDIAGPITVAAVYDGGMVVDPKSKATVPATRIVIVGASKFVENDSGDPVGINFFTNSLDWLVKKDAVLDISPKKPQEYGISLSPMQGRTIAWIALFFVPGAALALGIFTWFSRRK
jgi:ABC-type uncharacterized transport system involved in gliding motility auxiliary subunit